MQKNCTEISRGNYVNMVDLKINIPEDFLKEEVRCEFKVTKKMKEVWAVEIDLLCELLRVCQKHNIKIFASGGTLLGAIRHKGMIPWDDDIDMMMFRKDYDKLCEVASKEFELPYFFQTEYNDPGSLRGHAQLRNVNTTAILKSEFEEGVGFNQGIFIDIFPLDSVIVDETLRKKQGRIVTKYRGLSYKCARISTRYNQNVTKGIKGKIKNAVVPITKILFKYINIERYYYSKFEAACQKYNHIDSDEVSTLSLDFYNKDFYKSRKDFEEIINVPFEFITIPVGKDYDHALIKRYGDYHRIVKAGSLHGGIIFDTEKPYTDYIKRV